jgi:hypothetical protein
VPFEQGRKPYRATSLIRKRPTLGPYGRFISRGMVVLGVSHDLKTQDLEAVGHEAAERGAVQGHLAHKKPPTPQGP